MRKNLAELARAALMADSETGGSRVPTRLGSNEAAVADLCVRGDLGFALILHRRKDGLVAEEIYASSRHNGSWAAADHLSGGVLGIEPTSARDVAEALNGRSLVLFSVAETLLYTGRPQADEGYELLRFYEFLADLDVTHLSIEDTSPGSDAASGPAGRTLTSQVAVMALFPGERFTVRAMTPNAFDPRPPGEPHELTGPDPEPEHEGGGRFPGLI